MNSYSGRPSEQLAEQLTGSVRAIKTRIRLFMLERRTVSSCGIVLRAEKAGMFSTWPIVSGGWPLRGEISARSWSV